MFCIKEHYCAIEYFSVEVLDKEIVLEALEKNNEALWNVRNKFGNDYDIVLKAVSKKGKSICA